MELKTPLYEAHIALKAQMVPFAGYLMPVQYTSILAEHRFVREHCGVFDVSHMGEFRLAGQDALNNLNHILTNDFTSLAVGKARYSPMCYDNGGTVDDLLVYRTGEADYLLVVNASNRSKDFSYMLGQLKGDAQFEDVSDAYAQIALQGPEAPRLLAPFCALPEQYYSFVEADVMGAPAVVSRTGYTGEVGFEIYCPPESATGIFRALINAGALPCGLGARDTLRLEAGMPLYGHELTPEVTPAEAGLDRFIKLQKAAFTGREALLQPARRTLIGIEVVDKGIARQGDAVLSAGNPIGVVTSGTFSPTLNKAMCMAIVGKEAAVDDLSLNVRGRVLKARAAPLPFYSRKR